MRIRLIFFSLFLLQGIFSKGQETIDTVRITVTNTYCTNFYPARACASVSSPKGSGGNSAVYLDSIRVWDQLVDKAGREYYLVVKDAQGKIRLEGKFWDAFPSGSVIEYDNRGRKTAEGNYKLIKEPVWTCTVGGKKLMQPAHSEKTGEWSYWNSHGTLSKKKYK